MEVMKSPIPKNMRAIRQHLPNGELKMESIPVPQPASGEVLVKMGASPVNPSDLALLRGGYMKRNYPFTPGLEGSGVVVRSGGGLLAGLRNGKRVACSPNPEGDGTWAEYMITSAKRTIPLPHSISLEQGAMAVVNPMTAMAFMQLVKTGKHPAFVNNAAASSLGKMLIRLSAARGVPLINIVRNPSQVETLKELGATYVLNSQDKEFVTDLGSLAKKLGASLILDAIGGQHTKLLLQAAPPGATIVIYARLSGDPVEFDPGHLMGGDKKIEGFQLGNWLQTKNILFKITFMNQVKKQLGSSLSSFISQTYDMEYFAL